MARLVLCLARNILPRGEDDGLVGQRLPRDGAQRDEAVVVAAYGAVRAVATVPAAAAVAVARLPRLARGLIDQTDGLCGWLPDKVLHCANKGHRNFGRRENVREDRQVPRVVDQGRCGQGCPTFGADQDEDLR